LADTVVFAAYGKGQEVLDAFRHVRRYRGVLSGPYHLDRGLQVVGQDETCAIDGVVRTRDPTFDVQRGTRGQKLGDHLRQVISELWRQARVERGEGLLNRPLEILRYRELRGDELDGSEQPRLQARSRRYDLPHVDAGPVVAQRARSDERRQLDGQIGAGRGLAAHDGRRLRV